MTPSTIVTKPSRRLVAALGVVAATCTFLVTSGETAGAAAPPAVVSSQSTASTTTKVVAKDTFAGASRAVGTAEIGGRWAIQSSKARSVSTGGDQLTFASVPKGGSFAATLPAVSARDVAVSHGLKLPKVGAAKTGLYQTTELRRQSNGDRYGSTLTVGSGGALTLSVDRVVGGRSTQLKKTSLKLKATSNSWLTVETEVSGTSPVTVRARVRAAGQPAPAWQVVARDTSGSAVDEAGAVGVNGYLSSSGTPTSVSLRNFQAVETVPATSTARPSSSEAVVAEDSFAGSTRPVGEAEIGGRWAVQAPSGGSVTTGGNQLAIPTVPRGGSFAVGLPAVSAADVTVEHGVRLPSITSAKLGLYESTEVRRQSDGDRYSTTLTVGSGGALSLSADRVVDGRSTQLAKVSLPLKATSKGLLTVETKVSGTSPVTVQARVYPAGATAPAWQVTGKDTSSSAVKGAGSIGVNGYLSGSGTPTTVSLTSFRAVATTTAAAAPAPAPVPAPAATSKPRPAAPTPTPTATTNPPKPSTPPSTSPSTPQPSTPAAPGLPTLQRVVTNGFVHPGVLNGTTSLEASRAAVLAGKAPQKPAFDKMRSSRFANLGWTPRPVAYVGCGSYNTVDEGCTAETDDAQAAYTQALLWYYTGDQRHADKAKEILNAYSATLKDHKFDTKVYKNGLLQAGWAGQTFTKAAELIRYSGAGWSAADVARFETMLETAFLPRVINGWTWTSANWQLTMAEATMNIGVFTNDRATWENGVGDWRNHVKGSFYLASDGAKPNFPANTIMKDSNYLEYWSTPKQYVSGLAAETCRDASHTAMGLASALDAAETARLQGLDLYGEQRTRLVTAMEYNLRFVNDPSASGWVCSKPLNLGGTGYKLTYALGYNNYAVRGGMSLPETKKFLSTVSPTGSGIFMNWETLTHSAG